MYEVTYKSEGVNGKRAFLDYESAERFYNIVLTSIEPSSASLVYRKIHR